VTEPRDSSLAGDRGETVPAPIGPHMVNHKAI
jgi:hypothetical protein